jgi:hypothetical protein
LLTLTLAVFYSTHQWDGTSTDKYAYGQSFGLVLATAMIPVWIGLWCKATFDEQFLSVYDRCDHNLGAIAKFSMFTLQRSETDDPDRQPSKYRASMLLALTFVIRFVLTMLSHIGLAVGDLEYLSNAHAHFVLAISAARDSEENRRHTSASLPVLSPRPLSPSSSSSSPLSALSSPSSSSSTPSSLSSSSKLLQLPLSLHNHPLHHSSDADAYVAEMAEACIKFLAQSMSLFVTKLRSNADDMSPSSPPRIVALNQHSSLRGLATPTSDTGSSLHGWHKVLQKTGMLSIVSDSFLNQVECVIVPLPSPLEPTQGSMLHFCVSSFLVMFANKYFFEPFSFIVFGGKNGSRASKMGRTGLLMYMTCRLIVNKTRAALWLKEQRRRRRGGVRITTPRKGTPR